MLDFEGIGNDTQLNVKENNYQPITQSKGSNLEEPKLILEDPKNTSPITFIKGGIKIDLSVPGGIDALRIFYEERERYFKKI